MMNGRYGAIDLSSGEASEGEVPDDCRRDPSSYVSYIGSVVEERGGDGIAIASGLLTCSLLPASCMGFVLSPRDGTAQERMCPLTGYFGAELKLSGFDFVALSGRAEQPGYVWVRDGIIEFVASPELTGTDSWGRTDKIRADQGDRRIQVVSVGPWGDARLPTSQLVTNYWGGEDKMGCAAEFGGKSLVAVAVRGMGELELSDPEDHFARSMELRQRHLSALRDNHGLSSFTDKAAGEGFTELFHRKVACYGCPYPCRSYYKVFEHPSTMALGNNEPGYLVYDVRGLESMLSLGMRPRDVVVSLMSCARHGAEPMAVARAVEREGSPLSAE